jgi:hypothetical protein
MPRVQEGATPRHHILRYTLFCVAIIAAVVVPWLLFGDAFDRLTRETIASPTSRMMVAAAGVVLLAADVALPIPSTVVVSLLGACSDRLPVRSPVQQV